MLHLNNRLFHSSFKKEVDILLLSYNEQDISRNSKEYQNIKKNKANV